MTENLEDQIITITENAAKRLKNILQGEKTSAKGIRVAIDTVSYTHLTLPTKA